mgnify:CR=1 FL=1
MMLALSSLIVTLMTTMVMSYLAIGIEITFWVAPVVSLLFVLLMSFLLKNRFLAEDKFLLFSAASMGEMIGLSVGFSWPTLYFLHKKIFVDWMHTPYFLTKMIGALVLVAGVYAYVIAYFLYSRVMIDKQEYPFPTVSVAVDLLRYKSYELFMMIRGVVASCLWAMGAMWYQSRLGEFGLLQMHTVPTLLSMGFMSGHMITKPLLIGMMSRLAVLIVVDDIYFASPASEHVMLTFALGMVMAVVVFSLKHLITHLFHKKNLSQNFSLQKLFFLGMIFLKKQPSKC